MNLLNRTLNRINERIMKRTSLAVGAALALSLMPGTALAHADAPAFVAGLQDSLIEQAGQVEDGPAAVSEPAASGGAGVADAAGATGAAGAAGVVDAAGAADATGATGEATAAGSGAMLVARAHDIAQAVEAGKTSKILAYDAADIAAIGTQESSGHTICCPSFSCAYADAVMDGTVRDHAYYTCSSCSWTDWGGGNSSFRSVGTDEQLLREAHDQIAAGRPTVIHVRASYGEHWIALIGYENAADPDHLALANFVALDPWDGAQVNAASRFSLFGDGCEHISSR